MEGEAWYVSRIVKELGQTLSVRYSAAGVWVAVARPNGVTGYFGSRCVRAAPTLLGVLEKLTLCLEKEQRRTE
jgi:hypothetical protein